MLRFQHYKKTYGPVTVLQIEQLQLPNGIYWLRGENGSGKTTLLRSIAGLLPFEGEIAVTGLTLRRQRRWYTQAVSLSEAEPVYPDFLTGEELLRFYLATKGGKRSSLNVITDALQAATFLSQKTGTYSSGMLKKLSLLLSFVGHPKLILLDEPFTTLDVAAGQALRGLIEERVQQGVSFLVSSHQDLRLNTSCPVLQISRQTLETQPHAIST